jgi:hypothetical protein
MKLSKAGVSRWRSKGKEGSASLDVGNTKKISKALEYYIVTTSTVEWSSRRAKIEEPTKKSKRGDALDMRFVFFFVDLLGDFLLHEYCDPLDHELQSRLASGVATVFLPGRRSGTRASPRSAVSLFEKRMQSTVRSTVLQCRITAKRHQT